MKRIIVLLLFGIACLPGYSQKLDFDKEGRITQIEKTGALAAGTNVTIVTTDLDAAFQDFHNSLIDSCKTWLDLTIQGFASGTPIRSFYNRFWNETITGQIESDLKDIKLYLESGAEFTPTRLKPLYDCLKELKTITAAKWYTINDDLLQADKTYKVKTNDLDRTGKSYILQLRIKQLFNKLIVDLFNKTYTAADMSNFRGLNLSAIADDRQTLAELLESAKQLGKNGVNDMDDDEVTAMNKLKSQWEAIPTVKAIQGGSYFENWIWWRKGDFTVNPFELFPREKKDAKDQSVQPASANTSLLPVLTKENENINKVVLRKTEGDNRYISFFVSPHNVRSETDALNNPVESTQDVFISVHNLEKDEKAVLRLTKETPHGNTNSVIDGITEVVGLAMETYSLLNVGGNNWKNALAVISDLAKSSPLILDLYPTLKDAVVPTIPTEESFWQAFEKDLKGKKSFNEHLFNRMKKKYTADLQRRIRARDGNAIQALAISVANDYVTLYNGYVKVRKDLSRDSLVIATLHRILTESNRPPNLVKLIASTDAFTYHTDLLNTGATDKNAGFEYAVKSIRKNSDKTDSTVIAEFKYKNGKRVRFSAGAGIVYTFARPTFAHNTVQEGDPLKIESSSDRVSFSFGVHIYFWKMFPLDESWGHSKSLPAHKRFSFYAGLGIPKVFRNFYPGLSFDLTPGIRIIGGAHYYIHDRYKIMNNTIENHSKRFRFAGYYGSVNIYPLTLLKKLKPQD